MARGCLRVGGIEFSPHLRALELILHAIATDCVWPRIRKGVAGHSRGTKVDLVRDLLLTASNMYGFCVPIILRGDKTSSQASTFAAFRSGITEGGGSLREQNAKIMSFF